MKKLFVVFFALSLLTKIASAQTATVHITMANTTADNCIIWLPNSSFMMDYLKKGRINIPLDNNKTATYTLQLNKPEFVCLMCYDNGDDKSVRYWLYLSPRDSLNFKADFNEDGNAVTVTGKGSNNNQPLLGQMPDENMQSLYGDTLPSRIIAVVNRHYATYKKALTQYLAQYSPSADFIKAQQINLAYTAVDEYYDFKENNKYQIQKAYEHTEPQWQKIQDSLFAPIKLNNDEALVSYNYVELLRMFMLRTKEKLWGESFKNGDAFYKEWYGPDTAKGHHDFANDMQNQLQEKIINKYFTNASAEYLYAVLFDDALSENNPKNLVTIFDGFKQKYPDSKYVAWFGPAIDTIRKKEQAPLTADMVFVADNGTKLNTLEDVLALTKGKTVLLDMWGTWCGPCRNEIHDNGPAIKAYFKGKGLDYLYIANRDLNHQGEWKKLIAYFDMKGTHMLANANLTKDIMAKVKGTGFPTYVIIKKDGTWELSKAGYPMNREVLIQQLEAALAN